MAKPSTQPGIVLGAIKAPMLIELDSPRWLAALGALKSAGFKIVATVNHPNRLRLVDDVTTSPITTEPAP